MKYNKIFSSEENYLLFKNKIARDDTVYLGCLKATENRKR